MHTHKRFENYPVTTVLVSNVISLLICGCGFFILYRISIVFSLLYLLYILILEYQLLHDHCTKCFYWGKTCGFGQGRLSALFFRKGDSSQFCSMTLSWKDMIPDLMVSLIPAVTGIILLIVKFDLYLSAALAVLIAATTFGNSFVRGNLICNYCKQRDIGCPAEKLFNKESKK